MLTNQIIRALACYLLYIGFLVFFAVGYSIILYPYHTYFALSIGEWEWPVVALLILVSAFPILLFDSFIKTSSAFLFLLFYLIVLGPSIPLHYVVFGSVDWFYIFLVSLMSFALSICSWVRIPDLVLSNFSGKAQLNFIIVIGGLAFFVFYSVFVYTGEFKLVGVNDVYELRHEFRDNADTIMRYLIGVVGGSLAPYAIVYGWSRRRFSYFTLGVTCYLISYMVAGHKSIILSLIIMLGCLFILNKGIKAWVMVVTILSGSLAIFAVDFYVGRALLSLFSLDRMVLAPSVLNYLYYDFFSHHTFAYWGHSFLKGIVEYNYSESPAFLIGSLFFKEGDRANANLLADGYSNFGMLGALLLLFVFVLFGLVYEALSKMFSFSQRIAMFIPQVMFLSNGSPLTAVLTNGLIVLYIILLLTPDQRKYVANLKGASQ
ncbi:hypothetical protein [Pseudomonas sp. RL_15y_Pfl2_60]|uniref:hypothetical protein n=1 Tax=Pseudomonas sp. RL_15y_Pfl2_60 TaxID=3088709 RepID=UPI0030D7B2C0